MNPCELGGFAENPNVIDGTEEDYNAFNFCLAYDYYVAIINEDFDSLGEDLNNIGTWYDLMDKVGYWLNYDGEIGFGIRNDIRQTIRKIYYGTIITYKDRTFIEACFENNWNELGNDLLKHLPDDLKLIKKIK